MIASCPECQTRYRIAREKLGPNGARIRCSKCTEVFRVEPPSESESEDAPAAAPTRLLIAEADAESAKKIDAFLREWGIETVTVTDGAEALLRIHRAKPQAAILGAELPSMTAPAVAEVVKRTAELAGVKLVRIVGGADPAATPEFEADHTLEAGDLPDGLGPILERLGLGTRPQAKIDAPPKAQEAPKAPPVKAAPAPTGGANADEIAAAERLARIIVSDIVLYNDEKFAQGARDGNVAELLETELIEAGELFKKRVSEDLRAGRDFLVEELERRAAKKRDS